MNTIKFKNLNTKVIAHRGLSGIECENTNSAFVAAGNRSYFGIESDVHRTKDGAYLIFHDDSTKRITNEDLILEESNAKDLLNLKLMDKDGTHSRSDLKIPTLSEYISICKKYEKVAVLELKNPFPKEDIKKICEIISSIGYLDNTIFISFAFENLTRLRELYPTQPAQFLTIKLDGDIISRLAKHNLDLDIHYKSLNENNIKLLKENGIKINCWTCDDKDAAEELARLGIEYITSNILEAE